MKKNTRFKLIVIAEAVLALLIVAMVVLMSCYVTVGGALYPRSGEVLDLTGQALTAEEYEKLSEKLPDTRILWTIPLESGPGRSDAAEITLTTLSEYDLELLDRMTDLKTVHAEDCPDPALLAQLRLRQPQAQILFSVRLGGEQFDPDATAVTVTGMTEEDLPALAAFTHMKTFTLGGGSELSLVEKIRAEHPQWDVQYLVTVDGTAYPGETRELVLEEQTYDEILRALTLFPELSTLELTNPKATGEELVALQEGYPGVQIGWKVEAYGLTFDEDTVEMDFTGAEGIDLEAVEVYADSMPKLEKLVLGECGIDNERIAALRERKREDYKVVWTVRFTPKFAARTDSTTLMPGHKDIGEYRFNESMGVNVQDLKYFEDMVCMDQGHFIIYKADFLAYMPHLKFLILSWTEIHDLSPIVGCQELIYLELDWSQVRDFSPLVELKALQDLNVCGTVADVTPLTQMTWLDNLWAAERGYDSKRILLEAFPQEDELDEEGNVIVPKSDVYLYIYGGSTSAWRHLPHYYEMRDMLGMYYMDQ